MLHIKAMENLAAAEEGSLEHFGETPPEYAVDTSLDTSEAPVRKKATTTKVIVWVCLLNGLAWVWCSYILAWIGRVQIAESLSQVALTEIIGVVLVYAVKSVLENLSKNNSWPDKHGSDTFGGTG